jgi:hypothetical protein
MITREWSVRLGQIVPRLLLQAKVIRVKKMLDLLLRNDRFQRHISWCVRSNSIGIF